MKTLEDRVSTSVKANRRWQAGFVAVAAVAMIGMAAFYTAQRASGAPPNRYSEGGELASLRKRIEALEKLLEGVGREKKTGALLFDMVGAKSVVASVGDGKMAVLDENGLRVFAAGKGEDRAGLSADGLAVWRGRHKQPTTVVTWDGLQTAAPDKSAQTTVNPGSVSAIGRVPKDGESADEEALISAIGPSVRVVVIEGGETRAAIFATADGSGHVVDSAQIEALSKAAENAPKKP